MNHTQMLVDLHVRESELRLHHVDELIDTAVRRSAEPGLPVDIDPLLTQIQQERDQLARVLRQLHEMPSGDPLLDARRGAQTVHGLDAVVLRLRHLLSDMFGTHLH